MDTAGYLEKLKKGSKRGPHTKEQALADQIWTHFGKRLHFARIMKMIKEKGVRWVRECLEEVRKGDARDRLSLFIHKVAQAKIAWKSDIIKPYD